MGENGYDEIKKKIDESWKAAATKEKAEPLAGAQPGAAPEATFSLFATSLMMQALVALGEIENPATKKKDLSIPQARFIIDTLAMLQEKTRNNLSKDEAEMIESIIYELRMRFVAKKAEER